MRVLTTILACLVLATTGSVTAHAAPPSAVVIPSKATLLPDGSVQLTLKVRCNDQQQAFEWSVSIRQGSNFGSDGAGPVSGLITCDGRFHTVTAHVIGTNGPFTAGPATVDASVQLYDAVEGSDVTLDDRAVVRLRP